LGSNVGIAAGLLVVREALLACPAARASLSRLTAPSA